mmetsp:Transcript_50135/g.125873  ORF Transcript_50135/g.125873 Transcript_50135/m.125873 type:complete len:344 (-) Transcript_50135:86-1117(-)
MVLSAHAFCPWDGHRFASFELVCPKCGNPRSRSQKLNVALVGGTGSHPRALERRGESSRSRDRQWRKILFERQAFPDNYVDQSFLAGLRKNENMTVYDFWTVVRDSVNVTLQMCVVLLFVMVFLSVLEHRLSTKALLSFEFVLLVLGFLAHWVFDPQFRARAMLNGLKLNVLLLIALGALAPILATLTNAISDDTITAMTVVFLIIHVGFHDYGFTNASKNRFQAPTSLNAAIFASVLLASRLCSNLEVFALVFFSFQLFALFPILRHSLRKYSIRLSTLFSWLFNLGVCLLVGSQSMAGAVLMVCSAVFITFVCPFWLLWSHKFKDEINGPWDEAVPSTRTR